MNETGGGTKGRVIQNGTAPNSAGGIFFNMTSEWLNAKSTINISLGIDSKLESQTSAEGRNLPGPIFVLMSSKNTTTSSPSSSSKRLGEKVGIPVGLVVLILAVIAIAGFLFLRKRRGQGYGGSGTRNQRIAKVTTPVAGRGHRRDASFHDEPTRGVELQERNRDMTGEDNWEWGSPVSSPTSGERGSNAFRDEISRQRGGR